MFGAKTISFGLIYGMSSGSLQYRLNKTREEAIGIANRYWRTFPRIKPWLNEIIEECRTNGFVTYWSGRRWYEDERVFMYKGANATIQGGSHDLLMTAFLRTCDFLDKEYPDIKIFNLVHDELDFEIPDELIDEVVPKLQRIMEVEDLFDLKFFTDVKAGKNYGELEKVAKFG